VLDDTNAQKILAMLTLSLVAVIAAALQVRAQQAPIVYDSIHNATGLQGTWASGSRNVVTGPGFANPANESFTFPLTTGISYSFTDTGFYEIARYRFSGNGSQPTCITGVLNWVHGTYQLLSNGSIVMTPFGDGYQQIQDPCAGQSNFVENYNNTELYQQWRIFQDPIQGFKLHLFQFDGSPLAPQFQVSNSPQMLPTQMLRNVSAVFTSQNGITFTGNENPNTPQQLIATNASPRRLDPTLAAGMMAVMVLFASMVVLGL